MSVLSWLELKKQPRPTRGRHWRRPAWMLRSFVYKRYAGNAIRNFALHGCGDAADFRLFG